MAKPTASKELFVGSLTCEVCLSFSIQSLPDTELVYISYLEIIMGVKLVKT